MDAVESQEDDRFWRDRAVMITGGMGFIGSTLAIRLARAGARVLIVDAMVDDQGGNPFNIAPVADRVRTNFCDVRDAAAMRHLVRDQEFIFHLAGRNDHVSSLNDPFPDIEVNVVGAATLLEVCRRHNPRARLVYTGTRGEYGQPARLPVDEEAPQNPKGIYELSSLMTQKLFKIYNDNHGVASVTLRLTNTYGPRAQMRHDRFGVANWFVRKALDDEEIPVFGDGAIKRDFLYVDDAADAILRCAASDAAWGETLNVGRSDASSFRELAETIVEVARRGRWALRPFTAERATVEPGDFYSDIRKIGRLLGWAPRVGLREGVRRTVEFYREHRRHYWP